MRMSVIPYRDWILTVDSALTRAAHARVKNGFDGQNCTVPIVGTSQYTLLMTSINENFSIGFRYEKSLAYFEDNNDLVQVEFEAKLPWVIGKENESD